MLASAIVVCLVLGALPSVPGATAERVRGELHVRSFELVALDLPQEGGAGFSVDLVLRGKARHLELTHHSVRAEDFQLLVEQRPGVIVSVDAEPPVTYRGNVAGEP